MVESVIPVTSVTAFAMDWATSVLVFLTMARQVRVAVGRVMSKARVRWEVRRGGMAGKDWGWPNRVAPHRWLVTPHTGG